jgi:hypothetical protein
MINTSCGVVHKTDVIEYVFTIHMPLFFSSLKQSEAHTTPGLRVAQLFEGKPSKCISCIAIELEPQASSEPEYNSGSGAVVHVMACEDELASFTMNAAKMELRTGDHLTIPHGCTFHFTNSSLSVSLKLRVLRKIEAANDDVEDS